MKNVYTLEAGRCIVKNGVPLATLHGVGNYSPTELDYLARAIVALLNPSIPLDDALPTVRHTICRYCEQDIEGISPFPKGEWLDRGNNTKCHDGPCKGRPHAPVAD